MNLIIIQKNLSDVTSHLLSNLDHVIFDNSTSYNDLLTLISQKNNSYTNIGIFSHGNSSYFDFVETIHSSGNEDFNSFLKDLKTQTNFQNLDLFSCFFGNNSNFISDIESSVSINVRASTNLTGNEPFGDWIMETDNINIKSLYFEDSISSFNITLQSDFYKGSRFYNIILNNMKNLDDCKNQVYFTERAFASINNNGGVITWGNSSNGGNMTSNGTDVSVSLSSGVIKIFGTKSAFAALKNDGGVVTWGDSTNGGNSSIRVPAGSNLTSGVSKIFVNNTAFAALKNNGSVVTWGDSISGGNMTYIDTTNNNNINVSNSLTSGVIDICSTDAAFAALKNDGTVVTWGNGSNGGDSSNAKNITGIIVQLTNVKKIFSTSSAFCALTNDDKLIVWGFSGKGGVFPILDSKFNTAKIKRVFSNKDAFCALTTENELFVWGSDTNGGQITDVSNNPSAVSNYKDADASNTNNVHIASTEVSSKNYLKNIKTVFSNEQAFAAITQSNSVVTWGNSSHGAKMLSGTDDMSNDLKSDVKKIFSTKDAFCALKNDKSIVLWGSFSNGGVFDKQDSQNYQTSKKFDKIYSSNDTFIGIEEDNKNITNWGIVAKNTITETSVTFIKVTSNSQAFAVTKSDGSIQLIGSTNDGGSIDTDGNNIPEYVIDNTTSGFSNTNPGYQTDFTTVLSNYHLGDNDDNNVLADNPEFTEPNWISFSSGDPYITTMEGINYKLPNINRIYRCLETKIDSKKLVINASVSQLNTEELDILSNIYSGYICNGKLTLDGYFYEKFFISYGDEYIILDRDINILETNIKSIIGKNTASFFENISIKYNNIPKKFICPIQGVAYYTSISIMIKNLSLELLKIQHPQIINGIKCYYSGNINNVSGIFKDAINPKNYKVKTLNCVSPVIICKNTLKKYKKNLKETWLSVNSKNVNKIIV